MGSGKRKIYIDNIRLLMIILVVAVHLGVTYSGLGSWYYNEPGELDVIQTAAFGLFLSFTQGYFMGLLFLIAGYFVPASYDKKGFGKFIKDRLIRLGLPTLLYMLLLSPFISAVLLGDNSGADGIGLAYLKYIISFQFIGSSGPLWFAFALLVFSIIYAALRKALKTKPRNDSRQFPSAGKIIGLILLISILTFLVRIAQPIGTNIINMQLCFFPQYIALFIIGILCRRNDWLEKLDYKKGRPWLIAALTLGLAVWAVLMLAGGALEGNLEALYGGFSWQSAAYSLWESFVAVAMSIGLLALFKEKYNKRSKVVRVMSDNAFAVYVFHAPIIIALTLLFAPIGAAPFAKFVLLIIISIPVCFLVVNFTVRKIPFFR